MKDARARQPYLRDMTRRLALPLLALLLAAPLGAQRQQEPSPTLARWLAAVRPGATNAFWDSVETHGTPIIDAIPGDSRHMLAAFVYRSDTARNVIIENGVAGWTYALNQLARVAGTDVWHITLKLPADIRLGYVFRANDDLVPWHAEPEQGKRWALNRPDPYSRLRDSLQNIRSVIVGPRAAPDEWSRSRADVPHGSVTTDTIRSAALGTGRAISVYVPPGNPSRDLPLLVVFDGPVYRGGVRLPVILDNLIAAGKIRPVVAVFVSQVNRMVELAPNEAFGAFSCGDVIDLARSQFRAGLRATETTVLGSSHGGLAATWTAMRCPDRVGNVIAESPSYWWSPETDSEPEALTRQVARSERLPLRFWLEVGRFEVDQTNGGAPGQVAVARHMRDVLTAKGYDLAYSEFSGGHEYQSWRVTLPAALEHFLGTER